MTATCCARGARRRCSGIVSPRRRRWKQLIARLDQPGWQYSISVRMQYWVPAAIATIPESAWRTLDDYPDEGEAQIAETIAGGRRLVVRRTRLVGAQAEPWPDWRHFPFITNRTEPLALVEREHRQHAVVELAIRDLKDQALAHFPSGRFKANAAWTVIACLAHNLLRWTSLIGLPATTVRAARTVRRRLLMLPAASPAARARGRCTYPPAGPGSTTSSARWRASERCPPPPDSSQRDQDHDLADSPTPADKRCPPPRTSTTQSPPKRPPRLLHAPRTPPTRTTPTRSGAILTARASRSVDRG
jgi:hypothetical protein